MADSFTQAAQRTFIDAASTWTDVLSQFTAAPDSIRKDDGRFIAHRKVKSLTIHNNDSTTHRLQVSIYDGVTRYIIRTFTLDQYKSEQIDPSLLGNGGLLKKSDRIQVQADGTNPTDSTVSVIVVPVLIVDRILA